jgi:hypothetical protein
MVEKKDFLFGFYTPNKRRNICKKCTSIKMREYQKNNKEKMVEISTKYRLNNREKCRARDEEHYIKNRKRLLRKSLDWQTNNKEKARARNAKRRALKLNATVAGFDEEIKKIYEKCPEGYHVDHIIPLKHDSVCGLHVPWNLQYLTAKENLKKHNKLILEEFKDVC